MWSRLEAKSIPEPNSGCLLWFGSDDGQDGYGRIEIKRRNVATHRASWEVANGRPVPAGMQVLHKCDVPACINPDHLFLGTDEDNRADKMAKGRQRGPAGELHGMAKLTRVGVVKIRGDHRCVTQIAADYEVSENAILDVKRRKSWQCVP